ncbi:hypothetical protein BDP55DRAFT_722024 [Colletotrichum godetiae]|uniref:Uncharacterized protein n=1 Tax=Colletotrichum godetiae TaxID=1209918 RepID=A0AAJ0A534_9PEZI|nr:uncharacterized protein BDP55DRAFT_722024 [Colletotrichum godetiae]KAK1656637.1 hypothetical protein BDP55DRAFT_722024 [Colletotrichum godetiae]
MSHLRSFLSGNGNVSHQGGSTRTASTATLTDGTNIYGIYTPSLTHDSKLSELVVRPSAPEPTVLLREIQQAADDISQLVGRFGFKMARTLTTPPIKKALFADKKLLRLPCLMYADEFSCVITRFCSKPIHDSTSAPLLWWLWNELLDYLPPIGETRKCRLDFNPALRADIALPYAITIDISSKNNKDNIELTASYGGLFDERRIFDASITRFDFPKAEKYGKLTMATLDIDQNPYEGNGCIAHILGYLVPRLESNWRPAMEAFPSEKEEDLIIALAKTYKAGDDRFPISENQQQQFRNLLRRFPIDAREYVVENGLVGMEKGPYSQSAFQPPGPKD